MIKEKIDRYDAFISYRRATGFYIANLIYEKLVNDGYSVFLDTKKLKSEKEGFAVQLENAISKSSNFIMVLFQEDFEKSKGEEGSWLREEAGWALDHENIIKIPVYCDGARQGKNVLPREIKEVADKHGVEIDRKSLDSGLNKLAEYLHNANPVTQNITTEDFFKKCLSEPKEISGIDMAFHSGSSWLRTDGKNDILETIIKSKIKLRILINTDETAESVGQYIRKPRTSRTTFKEGRELWKEYQADFPELIEVRVCKIPLLHIIHCFNYKPDESEQESVYNRIHIKYYVYQNFKLDDSFAHEFTTFSKYYEIYKNEFEYLWNQSEKL